MKRLFLLLICGIMLMPALSGQHKQAYQIFDKEGNPVDYNSMFSKANKSDIVLFGELHNNSISHWLQLELTKDIFDKKKSGLVLGAEMFECDNQIILNEYLNGIITERNFRAEAKLWNNYNTDIRPLVEFAKDNNVPFIATNVPRRYASVVHRNGFEGLEDLHKQSKNLLPVLPIPYDPELPGYKAMLEMEGMPAHGSPNLPKAQAIKDATMAFYILKYFKIGKVFLHFHGTYHSNNYEGIYWYLNQYGKTGGILTISTVEQNNIDILEEQYSGQSDFIIVVPSSMTKTH